MISLVCVNLISDLWRRRRRRRRKRIGDVERCARRLRMRGRGADSVMHKPEGLEVEKNFFGSFYRFK